MLIKSNCHHFAPTSDSINVELLFGWCNERLVTMTSWLWKLNSNAIGSPSKISRRSKFSTTMRSVFLLLRWVDLILSCVVVHWGVLIQLPWDWGLRSQWGCLGWWNGSPSLCLTCIHHWLILSLSLNWNTFAELVSSEIISSIATLLVLTNSCGNILGTR